MSDAAPEPLPEELRELLRGEAARQPLPDAQLAELSARVGRSLASLPAAGATGVASAAGSAVAIAKWAWVAAAFAAGFATHAVVSAQRTPELPEAPVAAPAPTEPAAAAPALPSSPTRVEAAPAPPEAPAPRRVKAPAPPPQAPVPVPAPEPERVEPERPPTAVGSLERERVLIDMARSALARRRPADARAALEQHQLEHPSGVLEEEREFLWLQLLMTSGAEVEARSRRAAFEARWPQSLWLPALDALFGPGARDE